jgi:hypothetical protein
MIGIGIGIPFIRVSRGAAIDAQAQAHFDRVIADGGLVPSGLSGVNAFFTTVKTIYATSDITTAISVGLDAQVLGYKLGAGAGTTLGQAAQKLYSCSGASGDVVQTTAASQPLLLVHSGVNYYQAVGVTQNSISTPNNNNTFNLRGNFDFKFNLENLNTSTTRRFFSIGDTDLTVQMHLRITNTNLLRCELSEGGAILLAYDSTATLPSFGNIWVRVYRNKTAGEITFYTSTDGTTWTQLGAVITGVTTNDTFNSTGNIRLGSAFASFVDATPFLGKIYYSELTNSFNGSAQRIFNPNQYNAANSQTQWTSSTGEIWSIQTGTATTGYKGVLVDRTMLQSDAIDDSLVVTGLSSFINLSVYAAVKVYTNATASRIYGGSLSSNDHILFGNSIDLKAFNGAQLNFAGEVLNATVLYTTNFNSASSTIRRNNVNEVSGNLGSLASTAIRLFCDGIGGNFSNNCLNTILYSKTVDSGSVNTSVYNYTRSINNSAF